MAGTYDVQKESGTTKSSVLDPSGYVLETFTENYTITIDVNENDDAHTVEVGAQSNGLPSRGDSHQSKRNAIVEQVDTEQESPIFFRSVVTYKTPAFPQSGGSNNEPPWNIPTKFRKVTTYVDREVDHDYDGNPLRNPHTGETYSLIVQQADFGLHLTKAVQTLEFLTWQSYEDKVSTDSFLGFGPGQSYLQKVEAETANHEGVDYWNLIAIVLFRNAIGDDDPAKVWYRKILRKGLQAMTTAGVSHRIAVDSDGDYVPWVAGSNNRVEYRVALDENDEILADGEPPVYDFIKVKGEIPFSNLGFT